LKPVRPRRLGVDAAGRPAGSAWDFPQNRQNRASDSIGLPQERQNTVPLPGDTWLDNAAPL